MSVQLTFVTVLGPGKLLGFVADLQIYLNLCRFQKVPWSHIRVEHLHAWFYWSAFNTTLPPQAQLPEYHRTLLDESVELLEKRIGCKIPSGSNPSVKPILLTVDPVNVLPRPLGWYIFVKVVNTCILKWYEYKYGLSYGRFRDLESVNFYMSAWIIEHEIN